MMEIVSCQQYVPPMSNTKSRFPALVHSILVGGLTPLQPRYIDNLEAYYSISGEIPEEHVHLYQIRDLDVGEQCFKICPPVPPHHLTVMFLQKLL